MTEDAQAALLGRLRKKSHEELLFVVEPAPGTQA